MSLNDLLNSSQSATGKQPPQISRHVIRRKIEIAPKSYQGQNSLRTATFTPNYSQSPMMYQQPSPYQKQNHTIPERNRLSQIQSKPPLAQSNLPFDNDMLVFSLLTKILLPKDRIEKINILFQKLLLGKLSFATVSKTISNHLNICPILLEIWQNLLDRKNQIHNSLYTKISEIVSQFRENNISMPVLCNFISFISESSQKSTPYIHLFNEIISKFEILNRFKSPVQILQLALELLSLLPKSNKHLISTVQPIKKEPTFYDILSEDYRDKPFSISPHYSDISSFLVRNGKPKEHLTHRHAQSKDTIYTPSHHQNLIPIIETQPCLLFNYFTKSLNSGHEGGSRGHDNRHLGMPLPQARDIHDVLELPEIREHDMDAILQFDQNANYIGHIATVAALTVYDENTWEKIRPLLKSQQVRAFVTERYHNQLPVLMKSHYNACHVCDIFLYTRPINSFLITLKVPENVDGLTFPYYNASLEVSEYSDFAFTFHKSARYKYLPFFFRSVLPILSKENEFMKLILPKSGVMTLYYYSKLCEALVPLLSKEAIEFGTFESVFDILWEELHNRLPEDEFIPHQFLSTLLKSIIKNGTILDKMSYEVFEHFGVKSIYVAQIAPILNHLNSSCKALAVDPQWNRIEKFAGAFATNQDETALNTLFPLYLEQMSFPSHEMMYLLQSNVKDNEITVSLLSEE